MMGNLNIAATNLDRAIAAWGADLPEWVRLLADAADRTSQRAVADQLGKSAGYVSRLIRRDYAGSYAEAETIVVSDGFSCREQIEQQTDRRAMHLAELLQAGLHERGAPLGPYPERRYTPDRERAAKRTANIAMLALAGAGVAATMLWRSRALR